MVPPPARPARLLVVDDDQRLRDLLTVTLRHEGYAVTPAAGGEEALERLSVGDVDLVVLDIDLGDSDGRVLLSQIRAGSTVPVVMISGHGDVADRVLGLRLGADDYIAKPFAPVELAARVETVLRRASAGDAPAPEAPAAETSPTGLTVDEVTRDVRVDGRRAELTAREFDLLGFLVRSPRQVFSRGQILEHVWDSRSEWQDEATVTEHVRRIRRKIEADPDHPRWIVTVRGVGYRYEP